MIGEVDEYFYHGDHISSVVLVTDKKAKVVQQFAYMPFGELLVDNSTVDLDYRFSAKENDRESGLGYFGARYYDNTSAMWLGVDPLWEKYAGMNPYNYCAGNPVMLVDVDGREPTEKEAARMADHVYNNGDVVLTGGWKVLNRIIEGVTYNDNNSGFKSQLYERKTSKGKIEYTYALAGTDFSSGADWGNNAKQKIGFSKQYSQAMNNAQILKEQLGNNLTFVGHSLGGGMAAACAYVTSGRALTFNAAKVSWFTTNTFFTGAKIDAYVNILDELSLAEGLLSRDGDIHLRINRASIMGHSITNFYKPGFFEKFVFEPYWKMTNNIEKFFSPQNLMIFP